MKKKQQMTKKLAKLPSLQRVNCKQILKQDTDGIPERILWRCQFWKKSVDVKKIMKNHPACQELWYTSGCYLSKMSYMSYQVSADNICKQFGPKLGLTKCQVWSVSNQFDTLMVFLKEFFEEINFEKKSADDKICEKLYSMQSETGIEKLLVSADRKYWRLLITFANSLDPNQVRHIVGLDLDPICLTLRWYSWKIFWKY